MPRATQCTDRAQTSVNVTPTVELCPPHPTFRTKVRARKDVPEARKTNKYIYMYRIHMGGWVNRGRGPILPGLRSLHASQPISDRPAGLGLPHRAGRCAPGRTRFSSPGCRSCRDIEGCLNRGWKSILPGCGGTEGGSNGDVVLSSPGCARPTRPANQRSARGIEVSTPCGAVSTREKSIFVPGLSRL